MGANDEWPGTTSTRSSPTFASARYCASRNSSGQPLRYPADAGCFAGTLLKTQRWKGVYRTGVLASADFLFSALSRNVKALPDALQPEETLPVSGHAILRLRATAKGARSL
jgi:hypothetical protein